MRIACYGLVDRDAGSVASANYLILDELLKRGHEIHFFAKEDFVRPAQLTDREGFHYHGLLLEGAVNAKKILDGWMPSALDRVAEEVLYRMHLRSLRQLVGETHAETPFDVLLFLGVGAQFRVDGLRTVSWLQGPPQTEWEAIRRLSSLVKEYEGHLLYEKLRLYYAYRKRQAQKEISRSDVVICGSQWAREKIIESNVAASNVTALPYPFDLDFFTPGGDQEKGVEDRTTYLWLGRVDPRKRLDLLMGAFKRLVEHKGNVHLKIIARFSYARNFKKLIDEFPYSGHVTYREFIPREEVPELMRSVDVLVQPSESENFGSSVVEALACGTPVVLGPTNGTVEYVSSGAMATFSAYSEEALYRALVAAGEMVDRDAKDVCQEARDNAESMFNVDRIVTRLESIMNVREPAVEYFPRD